MGFAVKENMKLVPVATDGFETQAGVGFSIVIENKYTRIKSDRMVSMRVRPREEMREVLQKSFDMACIRHCRKICRMEVMGLRVDSYGTMQVKIAEVDGQSNPSPISPSLEYAFPMDETVFHSLAAHRLSDAMEISVPSMLYSLSTNILDLKVAKDGAFYLTVQSLYDKIQRYLNEKREDGSISAMITNHLQERMREIFEEIGRIGMDRSFMEEITISTIRELQVEEVLSK